jgi:DNA-binding HxlR family transcriptional regulator
MRDEVSAALEELEIAGLVERTGEMQWGELSCEWQPVYKLTELGRALSKAGISPDDYLNGVKS